MSHEHAGEAAREDTPCAVCDISGGHILMCAATNCKVAVHPACGLRRVKFMAQRRSKRPVSMWNVHAACIHDGRVYCREHAPVKNDLDAFGRLWRLRRDMESARSIASLVLKREKCKRKILNASITSFFGECDAAAEVSITSFQTATLGEDSTDILPSSVIDALRGDDGDSTKSPKKAHEEISPSSAAPIRWSKRMKGISVENSGTELPGRRTRSTRSSRNSSPSVTLYNVNMLENIVR